MMIQPFKFWRVEVHQSLLAAMLCKLSSSMVTRSSMAIFIGYLIFSTLTFMPMTSFGIPFVVFHGIGDKCSSEASVQFTELLSSWSGSPGFCLEIGNGVWDSWFLPFTKQTSIACEKVKKISELSNGYNIIGLSQGNMVGRGVIEFCDEGPPVKNLISLAGPHAGIASVPLCGSGLWCILADFLLELGVYGNFIQDHVAPAGYIKIPTAIEAYRKGCKFLPKLNNEDQKNASYRNNFASLDNLVLIMFEQDTVLVPKETSQFGYYPDGSWSTILPAQETTLYKEDWIGLRKLEEAGKVKYVNVSGRHLEISLSDMKKYILPYLTHNGTAEPPTAEPPIAEPPTTYETSTFWPQVYLDLLHLWPSEKVLRLTKTN